MANWSQFSAADFDSRRAPRRALNRAAADAAAGQDGLFFVPTPTQPAKSAPAPEQLGGQGDLFGTAEDEDDDGEPDWCCASAGEIAAYLARHAPGVSAAEIDALPRPVQAQARAARHARPCAECAEPVFYVPESQRASITDPGWRHARTGKCWGGDGTASAANHLAHPVPTCPGCGSTAYAHTQQPYGNSWDCAVCGRHDYHSIGD